MGPAIEPGPVFCRQFTSSRQSPRLILVPWVVGGLTVTVVPVCRLAS